MSQGGLFPPRGAYSTKLPDRTIPGHQAGTGPSQGVLGQSAPAYTQPTQLPPRWNYAPHSQYAPGPMPARHNTEKESNLLNDLSDEQRDEINEAFTIFDLDKDRHIDFHELRVALRALGFTPRRDEVLQMVAENGVPKPSALRIDSGRGPATYHPSQMLVPQQAFTRIAAQKLLEREPAQEVERAFYLFDMERKDYITLEDLERTAKDIGETNLSTAELQTMIDEFDYEGRGGISKEAFFGICLQ